MERIEKNLHRGVVAKATDTSGQKSLAWKLMKLHDSWQTDWAKRSVATTRLAVRRRILAICCPASLSWSRSTWPRLDHPRPTSKAGAARRSKKRKRPADGDPSSEQSDGDAHRRRGRGLGESGLGKSGFRQTVRSFHAGNRRALTTRRARRYPRTIPKTPARKISKIFTDCGYRIKNIQNFSFPNTRTKISLSPSPESHAR